MDIKFRITSKRILWLYVDAFESSLSMLSNYLNIFDVLLYTVYMYIIQ